MNAPVFAAIVRDCAHELARLPDLLAPSGPPAKVRGPDDFSVPRVDWRGMMRVVSDTVVGRRRAVITHHGARRLSPFTVHYYVAGRDVAHELGPCDWVLVDTSRYERHGAALAAADRFLAGEMPTFPR
jgi:hypothetical protein